MTNRNRIKGISRVGKRASDYEAKKLSVTESVNPALFAESDWSYDGRSHF